MTIDINGKTVGDLKRFLEDISDDTEICIYCAGRTGVVNGVEFEYDSYDLYINVDAESGYY